MKADDKEFTVSPFALLGNGVERPGSKRAKTDKPAPRVKAGATAKPADKANGKTNGNGKGNGHST